MKQSFLWFLFTAILLAGGKEVTELKRFAGDWEYESVELDGTNVTPDEKLVLTFKGDRVFYKATEVFKIKVSSSASPKEIDIIPATSSPNVTIVDDFGKESANSPVEMKGIYSLDQDMLILCFGKDKRPSDFSDKEASVRYKLKRVR